MSFTKLERRSTAQDVEKELSWVYTNRATEKQGTTVGSAS